MSLIYLQGDRLLTERQADFNRQLDHLAEPLSAMYEQTTKEYLGILFKFLVFLSFLWKFTPFFLIIMLFSFSRSSKGCAHLQCGRILNLDTQKLQTETTGAKIVSEIQDWLLTRVSSQETAVLPEDKMQCLLVGVSNSFLLVLYI